MAVMLYGHEHCPMVPVVRALLRRTGVEFEYVDIYQDEAARSRLLAMNNGHESVPTLVFPDGHHITEPSMIDLRAELKHIGYEMVKLSARDILRLMLMGGD